MEQGWFDWLNWTKNQVLYTRNESPIYWVILSSGQWVTMAEVLVVWSLSCEMTKGDKWCSSWAPRSLPVSPTLIKLGFYSDKHSHVIYIETMPRPGEIYINYSNPLPLPLPLPPPPTTTGLRSAVRGFGNILWWCEPDPLVPLAPLVKTSCLLFAGPDCVDCGSWQIFRERWENPPCVNMHWTGLH